jgi:single-stranded DNA-binding protein
MNSVAPTLILTEEPELQEEGTNPLRCTMRLAVPRHDRSAHRTAGVVYVAVTTFGLEARDCAERLRRGDRIGVTGRIEQHKYRTRKGWRVKHSVLIELPPKQPTPHEEEKA